jgi:hypothetical protein
LKILIPQPYQSPAMPERVQLKRLKGWRMPPNTVKVDRTTKWGNPFIPGRPATSGSTVGQIVADKKQAFALYRATAPLDKNLVAAARQELKGKNLACWCAKNDTAPDDCHAAILLLIANGN